MIPLNKRIFFLVFKYFCLFFFFHFSLKKGFPSSLKKVKKEGEREKKKKRKKKEREKKTNRINDFRGLVTRKRRKKEFMNENKKRMKMMNKMFSILFFFSFSPWKRKSNKGEGTIFFIFFFF